MRTIDATLTAALASKTRQPAVSLTIEDRTIHLSGYQTPGLADMWSDACVANDGSIIRVNITRGGSGFTSNFQFTRVTDPSVSGQWSTVTTFSGGSGNIYQDGGCAISNNSGTLRAFAQRGSGGNNIWVWTSTNNGASWTGPASVLSPPSSALTKGIASSGNNDVFFLYDVLGGEKIGLSTISGGVWAALTTSTLPAINAGAGLAVFLNAGVYQLVYSDGFTLYTAFYNGGSWFQSANIASTSSNSVGHISPRLSFFDGLYHLCNSEYDTGTITSSSYQYIRVRESDDFLHWSDGWIVPEISNLYGGNYLYLAAPQTGSSGARYYLSTMPTVLSTRAYSTAHTDQYLDVSSSVLSYQRSERINRAAELVVTIENKGGQFNGLVNLTGSTSYQPIGPGSILRLREGYTVSGTPDTVGTGTYRIMKIAILRTPTEHTIQISGQDLSERLDRKIRWQNVFLNQTLLYLLEEVCARASIFATSINAGTQLTETVPFFALQANQSYRHALDALCATYGLDYFLDQDEVLHIDEIALSDPAVWSYQNEIEQVAFGQDYQRANHVIANGKPPTGGNSYALTSAEQYDNTANAAMRVERILYHTDFKATTGAQASVAASLVLYAEQRAQTDTRLVVPLNPALQLLDVLTVTDASAPTGSGQSTVGHLIEQRAIYNAQRAEYESHLNLQGL